ncbi:MAG: hypothetical protein A2667_03090 [Candidatus Wildermuthbacteria bacterium RIFCSPHIGHO2_01_FULL_47_27]|uniref:Fibronectin type-III domain-containing protein n=2 Tax=Candidatus Wildermuthiibacteriota TaxID=1817923 RepID=A0A1G2RLV2_9BACT|nr:MAG: APHP domain protein [Parcubacteria group bacterium GW2011_GWA2_47_9]OHA63417.1 MAG: hypothetical protein A2667_03090 [Candidatus Wildermuthbacteria bacterium RIFCSPHIGHO2_01_FULL_47_27]OHA67986.1 MAG: hypothetical protein A3D59_02530 [Candidatus Wildermuthbacteria bacterium RIFCSPHIGHO2_02_FULL_47_17]OHA73845.1 MAG: hypothetical protein A3A32_02920 [Candidatus Wildermuthbacteria bacterium RIFCSPLOWO2_01_FULL_48_35]
MNSKILLAFVIGFTVLTMMAAPFAYAKQGGDDANHGSRVSEVAHESNKGPGHGSAVSMVARDNHGHDDDEDGDENEERDDGHDRRSRGPGNGDLEIRIRNLQQLIELLRALLAQLIAVSGGSPDTAAPVISSVAAQDIESDEAKIVWVTNEAATSKVFFSTTSPVNLATAQTKSKGGLDLNHRISLDELSASTTFFFVVESADASGNVARSAESSFTTLPAGPAISAVSASGITSSSATINWTTDRPANSRVYFSSNTAVDLNTAASVTASALVTSHRVALMGLSASTTYTFVAESTDEDGRMSRSAESSFATANP